MKIIATCCMLEFLSIDVASATQLSLIIERNMTCADGSIMGRMIVNNEEIGRTLELPWRDNQSGVSNIPSGEYKTTIRSDGNMRWRIEL